MTAISDRFVALTGLDDQTQLEFSSTTCGIPPRRSAHAGVQTPIYPSDTDPVQPPTTVLHLLPIADQVTQQKIWGEIVSWLRHCETRNLQLSSVTDDTFRSLFIRLVVLADPTCAPLSNSKEILESEETTEWKYTFHCILEKLFYPFIDSVNLQWVDHPMDCASWPYLLSILYWLTTKGKVRVGAEHLEGVSDRYTDEGDRDPFTPMFAYTYRPDYQNDALDLSINHPSLEAHREYLERLEKSIYRTTSTLEREIKGKEQRLSSMQSVADRIDDELIRVIKAQLDSQPRSKWSQLLCADSDEIMRAKLEYIEHKTSGGTGFPAGFPFELFTKRS